MKHAGEDMHLDVRQARGNCPIGGEDLSGCRMVLVGPNDANRLRHCVELPNEVEHPRAVAGDARIVAEMLGTKDSVGAAIAKTHHRDTATATRKSTDVGAGVCHIGFSRPDFLDAWL